MRNLCVVFLVILGVLGELSESISAESLPKEKMDAFISRLEAACAAKDINGIKSLYYFDGVPSSLQDISIGVWEDRFRLGIAYRESSFVTVEQYKTRSSVSQDEAKYFFEPRVMNGRMYVYNLSPAGMIIIHFKDQSVGQVVGVDGAGNFKMLDFKRLEEDKATTAVLPLKKMTPKTPSKEQVSAFTVAVKKACESGRVDDYKSICCTDGVAEEAVDFDIYYWDQFISNANKWKMTPKKIEFELLENYLPTHPEIGEMMAPRIMNGKKYGPNLPIVGVVTMSWGRNQGGYSSQTKLAGMDSQGNLKLVLLSLLE